jgi:hypothetical protein
MGRTTIGEMMQAKANVEGATGQPVNCNNWGMGWQVVIGGIAQDGAQYVTLKEAVAYLRAYWAGYRDAKAPGPGADTRRLEAVTPQVAEAPPSGCATFYGSNGDGTVWRQDVNGPPSDDPKAARGATQVAGSRVRLERECPSCPPSWREAIQHEAARREALRQEYTLPEVAP